MAKTVTTNYTAQAEVMFSRDMMATIFLQVQKGRITLMAPMAMMFSSEVKAQKLVLAWV